MLPLALFRGRSFGVANGLTLVASAGFYAYLLANVLFLTSVWRYSVLEAGLALTPGPLVAAPWQRPSDGCWSATISAGCRPRRIVWAAGVTMLVTRLGETPDFLGEWLPAILVLGVGAGATLPALGTTAIAAAPGGGSQRRRR